MTADTLVRDAVEAAVDEWGVGFQNIELSCVGVVFPVSSFKAKLNYHFLLNSEDDIIRTPNFNRLNLNRVS